MSIIDRIKQEALNQFIEVIEWLDPSQDTAARFATLRPSCSSQARSIRRVPQVFRAGEPGPGASQQTCDSERRGPPAPGARPLPRLRRWMKQMHPARGAERGGST